ncbi:hypothetical protein [Methanobrevibacter sp.]|uniref:hypothetical protein n=1 Tax=Methanobrevibacter sp. TaxID=66852 RepID=UPI00388CFDA3
MNRKIIIALIAIVIIIGAGAFAFSNFTSNGAVNIDANALEDRGNLIVDAKNLDESMGLYHTDASDTNTILIKNGGILKLANSLINKTGDTQTSGDDADFYGVNSAILVNTNGTLDISNVEIETNSKGSNGIFVTNADSSTSSDTSQEGSGSQPPEATGGEGGQGQQNGGEAPEAPSGGGSQAPQTGGETSSVSGNTQATIKNVKITTHSDKSRGLDATYAGKITADNVIINTDGQSCAALATDRGEGEVTVSNSDINTGVSKTSGRGSPLIYSTGEITVENTKGTSHVSQIACIEGKNSISLANCDLTGYGEGNRQDGDEYVDLGGIFIYQSMSGDADVGTSTFNATNSNLKIAEDSSVYGEAPMFHITNTACVINLENTKCEFGSGVFLEASSQSQWGTTGSNGGSVELNTNNEDINGNVIVDSISSLTWNMQNTKFSGAINSTGTTNVVIDSGSTWTLTGDSTVSSLEVNGNIEYGEYTLTINGVEYSASNPYNS